MRERHRKAETEDNASGKWMENDKEGDRERKTEKGRRSEKYKKSYTSIVCGNKA